MFDMKSYQKNYYLLHRQEIIERSKLWKSEHKEKAREYYINAKKKVLRGIKNDI